MEQIINVTKTNQVCASCEEELEWTEEVYLLEISQLRVQVSERNARSMTMIPVLAVDGDFLYEPHWFHLECWESIYYELQESIQDQLPVLDAASVLYCKLCKSGICDQEYAGTALYGEIHRSGRQPSPESAGEEFVTPGPPDVICIYCLHLINDSSLEMWSEGVSQIYECSDCTQKRCWRQPCDCTCHDPSED